MFSSNCLLEKTALTQLKKVSVFLLCLAPRPGWATLGEEQATLGAANPRVTPPGPHRFGSLGRLQLCADGSLSTWLFETALV